MGAWWSASRPKTLAAAVAPIAVGTALAVRGSQFRFLPALGALLGALLIQVGTNLVNDAEDSRRGADTASRLGPSRATQQGWLTFAQVMRGAVFCFFAAVLVGLYLVSVSSWWLFVVGLVSIAAGYAYTGGPFPLGYHGLGDVFVFVFFGVVAVNGTLFVQAVSWSWLGVVCAIPVGALGVALLAVNNVRDRATDVTVNKRTLVVRFGDAFGRAEWFAMLGMSALVPVGLTLSQVTSPWVLISWLSLPLAVEPARLVRTAQGAALNRALALTARLQLVFCLLFAFGLTQ
jgi:1,4-dihydroxy-2-naphthoate polyprenyltransferase